MSDNTSTMINPREYLSLTQEPPETIVLNEPNFPMLIFPSFLLLMIIGVGILFWSFKLRMKKRAIRQVVKNIPP